MRALGDLAADFWAWRVAAAPDSGDDITRVERPDGWTADWSAAAVAERRRVLGELEERHAALDLSAEPVPVQVDGRLIGSALARARWELDLSRGWQRNPCFYLEQSLIAGYNLLLRPPPFETGRAAAIVAHLRRVPVVLEQARENLTGHAAAPFARSAITLLETAGDRLRQAMAALAPLLPRPYAGELASAADAAAEALAAYRRWLESGLAGFGDDTAVGARALAFFLHRVALVPYPADRLRAMGRQEWDRAVATEAMLRLRHRDVAAPPLPADAARVIAQEDADERGVRRFYTERGLLGQPSSLRRYRFAAMPPYLAPLTWLGVPHYAGSASRPGDDALRYVEEPHPGLPYFQLAEALDPRTGIAHEGVHAQQLALSWQHPDPVRRGYYDSHANEGIAFYNEELMLLSGLFDDAPYSALFVVNAMRLRALRVEVDLALAVGETTLEEAAERLATAVPMDAGTAWEEAVFFAGSPGQGLSYQIGKLQILDLLATCRRRDGDDFDLRAFHDRLWLEGNVPIVLQRWELLGLRDQLDEADRLAAES
ncbi:DUF885 family protein [Nonomuraea sp. NPDC046570]|uniref:DUF885 family protein n=1 Tax=Nonomuraea sp. NPDC046570 TaxID=3155255 RepID=UPI0033E4587C